MAPYWYIYEQIPPYPHRIVDCAAGGFGMGAVGGGIYHFVKRMYNSPKRKRFNGGAQAFRLNSPRLGGYFAAWAATIKKTKWNFIIGAAATGGLFDVRKGFRRASRSALTLGITWTFVEGAGLWLNQIIYPTKSRYTDLD
ncbi:hypothetical protein MKX01_000222 [Papaver californicum]|nr:hypothetical protein MKX01_000222 [Papaver californicum]